MSAPSATTLPPDIAAYIAQLHDADRAASSLVSGLSDEQANWRPHGGAAWSLAQCLDHMAATNICYVQALQAAAPAASPGHVAYKTGGFFSRFFLARVEPPVSMKVKAPKKIQPASMIPAADALSRFRQSTGALRHFALDTAALNLCAIRFKSPFVPILMNFTVASGLLLAAAHCRRHLWQMEQVWKQPDFPR